MEEFALVFSSLAGACTAVALDKIPKRRHSKQPLTVNSAMENQLQSLKIEKGILTKTIARLQQDDSNVSGVQRDKLLIRYQHQLGIVIAKIEKLEVASKYPDLGPIGDSLISLMDNKLSQLDQKLYEISSKIVISQPQQPKQQDHLQDGLTVKSLIKKIEQRIEPQKNIVEVQKERHQIPTPLIEIPPQEKRRSVELSTLTEIPNKMPEFPAELIKPTIVEPSQVIEELIKIETPASELLPIPAEATVQASKADLVVKGVPKTEIVQREPEEKLHLPSPLKIPEEEKLDDDDKDIDKIKSEIMKALSKLEQVEVE